MTDSGSTGQTQTQGTENKSGSGGRVPGFLALLLAAAALLIAGWASWQLRELQNLPERISMEGSRLANLNRQLDTLVAANRRQDERLAKLAASLESDRSKLSDLDARIAQSEQLLANLPQLNASSRADWLKAEAMHYLQIANTQVLLAGDPQSAAAALQFADDRLRDANDPALAAVRAQLTLDLAALRAIPQVDRAGMSFRLQALADQAVNWPFRNTAPQGFAPDVRGTDTPAEGTAWQRFVAALREVLASFVSIKQTDAPPVAQLSAAERALIVESVKAELQLARLALSANDPDSFRQSVQQTSVQVRQYFDGQAAAVAAALDTLAEMQTQEIRGELPDISGALNLLQKATNRAAPVEEST